MHVDLFMIYINTQVYIWYGTFIPGLRSISMSLLSNILTLSLELNTAVYQKMCFCCHLFLAKLVHKSLCIHIRWSKTKFKGLILVFTLYFPVSYLSDIFGRAVFQYNAINTGNVIR